MFFGTVDFEAEKIEAYKLNWPSQNAQSALRPFHALSLRVRGNATFIHNEKEVTVQSGDIVFVPAYYRYKLVAGKEDLYVIHFYSDASLPREIVSFSPAAGDIYRQLFENICRLFCEKPFGYALECRSLFYHIASSLERDSLEQENIKNDRLQKVIQYIHSHFTDPELSVGSLARYVGISETYLRRIFIAGLGETPIHYIQNLRMQYAIELLKSGYYTVAKASDKSGFSSPYYFSAFIKRHTGRPPTDYLGKL